MNILQKVEFEGEKPGINFDKIVFIFDEVGDKKARIMTVDWIDGQYVTIDEIIGNAVIGRIITNDPKTSSIILKLTGTVIVPKEE